MLVEDDNLEVKDMKMRDRDSRTEVNWLLHVIKKMIEVERLRG